jgi:hypothetical protein
MLNQKKSKIKGNLIDVVYELIDICKKESSKSKKVEILNQINSHLLTSDQINVPSQITVEQIDTELRRIRGNLLLV